MTVQSLILEDGLDGTHVKGVMTSAGAFYSNVVILALGHSSRDLFRTLHTQGLAMEAKPFAMGFRIEHPQRMIDERQYRDLAGHPRLGAASYSLLGMMMCVTEVSTHSVCVRVGRSWRHPASGNAWWLTA